MKISVIIPTFNRADFLKGAIESVLDQDYFCRPGKNSNFELLVIDDGSFDDTREICESFEGKVKFHFQNNQGVSAARNLGLKLSRGEYIAYLDSDDLWKKNKLSIQMDFLKSHPEAVMCCTGEIWIRRGVFVNPRKRHQKYSGWIFDKVLPLCLLSLSSALFRKKVFGEIGNFDEEFPVCEDYDFSIRLAFHYPLHFIPEPLIVKRGGHSDQLSKKYWGMDRFRVKALEKALKLQLSSQQERQVLHQFHKKCKILINGFRKREKFQEADEYISLLKKYNLEES